MVRLQDETSDASPFDPTCPIAKDLCVHVAAAKHILKCLVQPLLRRGWGWQGLVAERRLIRHSFMHSDRIGGLERSRTEVLMQGGQQRRIALTPRVLCLVPTECLADIVTCQPIDEIADSA